MTVTTTTKAPAAEQWPGWPGDNVFRMIVPVVKVGSIIGKGGEIIKKICDESRARVRILDGPKSVSDRVVLISAKEDPEAEVSPAMDAVFRVFKRISAVSSDGKSTNETGICSVRLLLASAQASHLIGKQGSTIKSMQEESGAIIHVLNKDERSYYAIEDERIVDIQGESLKVLKALEAVIGHIRKFLVDHSMLPLFEKNLKATTQDRSMDAWSDQNQSQYSPARTQVSEEYSLPLRIDSLYFGRERPREPPVPLDDLSPHRQDPTLAVPRFPGPGRLTRSLVTQVTQKMQIPLAYAVDIIGRDGANLAYIRGRSGATVVVLEGDEGDEAVVEIRGTPAQIQTAQQLVEESMSRHKEPVTNSYLDSRPGQWFSRLTDAAYPSSSLATEPYSQYGLRSRNEPGFSQLADRAYPSSLLPTRTYGEYELSPGFGGYGRYG